MLAKGDTPTDTHPITSVETTHKPNPHPKVWFCAPKPLEQKRVVTLIPRAWPRGCTIPPPLPVSVEADHPPPLTDPASGDTKKLPAEAGSSLACVVCVSTGGAYMSTMGTSAWPCGVSCVALQALGDLRCGEAEDVERIGWHRLAQRGCACGDALRQFRTDALDACR